MKYKLILNKINKLQNDLLKLQRNCKHPKKETKADSYSYSQSEGVSYAHNESCCANCGKHWGHIEQERKESW